MTTKLCPKCKEEIQGDAMKCKHCWADLRNWFRKHYIISTLLWLIILGSIIGSSGWGDTKSTTTTNWSGNTTTQPAEETVIKISSTQLYKEYAANEIKADELYKGKFLEVNGSVTSIAKGLMNDMYITLEWDQFIGSVQCMLKSSEKDKAIQLAEGKNVTVKGTNWGKLGNVVINNCIIYD